MIIDLIYLGIFLVLTVGIWLIYLSVAGTTGLITLFSTRIPIINGIYISALFIIGGLMGYLDETPWNNPLNPVVTVLIGIGIYIICHFVQKTKVGFWLFAMGMQSGTVLAAQKAMNSIFDQRDSAAARKAYKES